MKGWSQFKTRHLLVGTLCLVLAGVAYIGFIAGCGSGGGGDGGMTSSRAVHEIGLFELDGNVADDSGAGLPDDWANIFAEDSGAFVALPLPITADGISSAEASFFTGGGSKDTNLISQWLWEDTNDVVPDKDDIAHVFAAGYEHSATGDTIFYFGADRFDTSGSAEIGFWFFRAPVGLDTKPNFSGEHTEGDILVLANFVNGGSVGVIDVYKWVGGKDPLEHVADADVFALVNNTAGENPPWAYFNKDGQETYQVGALFEGGINLNQILGTEEIGCFSTFMAETRSSHSTSAQLKDFALGEFPVCGINVVKSGDELSKVGDEVSYSVTIENTGKSTLYMQSITDSLAGDLTGGGNCGASLAPGATCTVAYGYTVQAGDEDPLENTVEILYNERSDFTGIDFADSYTIETNLFQPSIALDKKVNGSDGPLTVLQGDELNYAITLANTSSADSPNLVCSIVDEMLGIDLADLTLPVGGEYAVGHSMTATVAGDAINTATATCSPEGFPNVLTASDTVTVTVERVPVLLSVVKSGDAYGKATDMANYTITITNDSELFAVELTSISDTLLGDLTDDANYDSSDCTAPLDPGASCTILASYMVQGIDPDPLPNTVSVEGMDQFGNTGTAVAEHSVDLVHPDFTVAKTCLTDPVPVGSSAHFQIDIVNTGDVALLLDISDPTLGIDLLDVLVGAGSSYQIEGAVTATGTEVTNRVDVHATLPAEFGLPNEYDAFATGVCTVEGEGATRTWGFWKTHGSDGEKFESPVAYGYTGHVFYQHLGGYIDLGWVSVDSYEDLFGLFWAKPAKNSDGTKRDQLCMTKLHASNQLLAAILNTGLDNGAAPPEGLIEAMITALEGTDRQAIIHLMGELGAYNESGDGVAIVESHEGVTIPHADPRGTRGEADASIADCGAANTGKKK